MGWITHVGAVAALFGGAGAVVHDSQAKGGYSVMGSRESGEQFAIFADHRAAPLLEGDAWCAACGVPLQGGWRRVWVVAGMGSFPRWGS